MHWFGGNRLILATAEYNAFRLEAKGAKGIQVYVAWRAYEMQRACIECLIIIVRSCCKYMYARPCTTQNGHFESRFPLIHM